MKKLETDDMVRTNVQIIVSRMAISKNNTGNTLLPVTETQPKSK